MSSNAELIKCVWGLVEAENKQDPKTADPLLAFNFTQITRARGEEQGRDALLQEIEKPNNPDIVRRLDEDPRNLWVCEAGQLAVVRSLVHTNRRSQPESATEAFRNTHVFERQEGSWRCIAWQVTKLTE